ncbi:MAG: hypothetical protein IAE81_17330 [Caldilineaceae bacterium]|nr:hypothetical protein [Caldilineaceae bacterium]
MEHQFHGIELITIFTPSTPSFKERLAATELRRGLYGLGYRRDLRVGELPGGDLSEHELRFVLTASRGHTESYTISAESSAVKLHGAGEQALLYAVFDFLERQGTAFGIDGDLYPLETPASLHLPDAGQPWVGEPRFAVRGLLPWPDFLNCVSVYNREDWRAYLESMLRMRFNTLGIHVYGQEDQWAESFLSFEYGGVGHLAHLDTTVSDRWGYLPQRTSRYGMSAAQYFDDEIFGADSTRYARGPWEAAEMAQQVWREAFGYAAQLGIRTGVGFEPYRLPEEIRRACPPEVRREEIYDFHGRTNRIERIDPDSRAARYILETRLAQLLEAYPSVHHIYLWEDEMVNWASQRFNVPIPVTPFVQAYEFLRRHAPDKRLVLAGWGGVVRHFPELHRALPEEIIFTALNDQVGWDPVHEAFGELGDRERWPIPWLEDDPAMWFPQFHVNRFAKDLSLAEQYGCQGVLGIHWRHRIVDPTATYMARRFWNEQEDATSHYRHYAATQAAGERAGKLTDLLTRIDQERPLLATWNGEYLPDGHHVNQGFSGDYSEAFTIESGFEIPDRLIDAQQAVIAELDALLDEAESPLERERLGYLFGQVRFLDPYAQAWRKGVGLHQLIMAQQARKQQGDAAGAAAEIRAVGVPLWIEILGHVREAVLSFQHTVATRNDLGMLASVHNKFVRIATFRFSASLLEFLDELPLAAEAAYQQALAPDELPALLFVPTRPTRLAPGESVIITAVAPGSHEVAAVTLWWRSLDQPDWATLSMQNSGRRTFTAELAMPQRAEWGVAYYVEAHFAAAPAPLRLTAPASAPEQSYLITQ